QVPSGIAVDTSHDVYLSFANDDDGAGGCIVVLSSPGYGTPTMVPDTSGVAPEGIAVSADGSTVYFANGSAVESLTGGNPPALVVSLAGADGVAVDATGALFAIGSGAYVLEMPGAIQIGTGFGTPSGVAVDPRGARVYVANSTASIPTIYLNGRLDSVAVGSNSTY